MVEVTTLAFLITVGLCIPLAGILPFANFFRLRGSKRMHRK